MSCRPPTSTADAESSRSGTHAASVSQHPLLAFLNEIDNPETIRRISVLNRAGLRSIHQGGARSQEAVGTHPYSAFRDRMQTDPWQRSMEPVVQSLLTVDSMTSAVGGWSSLLREAAGVAAGSRDPASQHPVPASVWYEGQWVDTLDTVGQWLEAVIMEVSPGGAQVFVHYNGWTTRWDEWLPATSPRLAPFRTHTVHTLGRRLAPVPMVIPAQAPIPPPSAGSLVNVLPAALQPLSNLVELLQSANSTLQGLRWDMPALPDRIVRGVGVEPTCASLGRSSAHCDDLRDLEQPSSFPDRTVQLSGAGSASANESRSSVHTFQPVYNAGAQFPAVSRLFPPSAEAEGTPREDQALRLQRLAAVLAVAAPLADRLGRVLSDMGPHLGRASRNMAAAASLLSDARGDAAGDDEHSRLASALAAEGVHLDTSSHQMGIAALPSHMRNLHTAGGALMQSRPGTASTVAPVLHSPPASVQEYWQRAGTHQTDDDAEAGAAARAARMHSQWIRALRLSHLQMARATATSDVNSHHSTPQEEPLPLTHLTTLRSLSIASDSSPDHVRHSIAGALASGRLTQVNTPAANLQDVGGDVDDRLQLQASLAAIRRSLQSVARETAAARDTEAQQPRGLAPLPPGSSRHDRAHPGPPPPRPSAAPLRSRVPRPPGGSASSSSVSDHPDVPRLLGNAPPEASQPQGPLGRLHFENSHATDVGPAPQLAPRARRVSVLGARVRSDRARQQARASQEAHDQLQHTAATLQQPRRGLMSTQRLPLALDVTLSVVASIIPSLNL